MSGRARALDPDKALSDCTVDAWRVRDGLPGAWVRGIAQTPEGYLWIATYGGVARYGGERLTTLPAEPPLQRLSDALAALTAPDGTLYLVPAVGPPACFRAGAPRPCLRAGQALGGDLHTDAAAVDHEGALWLAGAGGIRRIGADGSAALLYAPSAMPPAPITALFRDRQGVLWLGTSAGLMVERQGHLQPQSAPAALGAVGAIFPARGGGELWVAGAGGLLRIGPSTSQLFESGPPARRPTAGLEDSDGNVWIATRGGLLRFRDRRFALFGKADGLPDDDLEALFEDREGSLWLGTRGAGLVQITDRTLDSQSGPPSLRDQWISGLCEDDEHALFVATNIGLVRWKNGVEQTIGRAQGLPSEHVRTVHPAPGGGVWIGTDAGLCRWRAGQVDRPVALSDPVSSIHVDREGVTWLGTEHGLVRVNADLSSARIPGPELRGLEVRGLQHDDQGVLWASAAGRLARLQDGELRPARLQIDGRPIGRVRSLHRDDAGTLWLGTANGLVRRAQGRWQLFPAPAREIFQMVSDQRGYLWAGTGRGILRIDERALLDRAGPPGRGLVLYDTSGRRRDVAATRTRQPSAVRAHDGSLWFATARGVVRVDPARLRLRQTPPAVRIEAAVLDGRPVARDGGGVFPPGGGNLEVHFSAITLVEPDKARHRYRLEGYDRDWIDAGNRRLAYYTNLPAGRYRFRVQGSNADGVWNEAGDALAFRLRPHLHQTFWFYALCALGVLGLGLTAHRLQVRGVRKRFLATLAERGRIARELHDSLLQGMAAAAMRLRALRKKLAGASEPAVTDELRAVEELVAASIVETRQVVLDLRERSGPTPELGAALSLLARQQTEGTPVRTEVTVEGPARPLAPEVQRELLRIAGEAVKNAVLHAAAGRIDIQLRYAADGLTLSVADDGQGFDPARAPAAGHFGLQGLRERAARLGKLALDSAPGRGTRVQVQVSTPYSGEEAES